MAAASAMATSTACGSSGRTTHRPGDCSFYGGTKAYESHGIRVLPLAHPLPELPQILGE